MKRIILGLVTIAGAGAIIASGMTGAFFSDEESSAGNTFAAGAIDLKVDNESYYNGVATSSLSWDLDDLSNGHLFFNFHDLKPDDEGEDTISLHVQNDAWACMDLTLTSNDDRSSNEPELEDGDVEDVPEDLWDGELAQNINMVWWADDGDNVLEDNENIISGGVQTLYDLATTSGSFSVALADAANNVWGLGAGVPLPANETVYIAKAWCFGDLTLNPVLAGQGVNPTVASGILCDGANLDNTTQTDASTLDIQFEAIQARHNDDFLCNEDGGNEICEGAIDLMIVMDNSTSINDAEETTMQAAAVAFVNALGISPADSHAGLVSFSTGSTLSQELTDSLATIEAAINAPFGGGSTNLESGIVTATTELASVRDRADGTYPDAMVILTDGNPNLPTNEATAEAAALAAAEAARAAGIDVYVVGIGTDVDAAYLMTIADPGKYYAATDFEDLELALLTIANCGEVPEGTLTIEKIVDNSDGGAASAGDFSFFANGNPIVLGANVLTAGSYVVTEIGPAGYAATFGGDCDADGNVTVTDGGNVTCIVTNTFVPRASLLNFPESFGVGGSDVSDIPGWEEHESGTIARAPQVSGEDTVSPDGGLFAKIAEDSNDGSSVDGWICRSVNATGVSDLELSYYWRGDADAESSDSGLVQAKVGGSCSDTGGWTLLKDHDLSIDSSWTQEVPFSISSFDETVFLLRFYNDSASDDEFFRVDGVELTGIPS